MLVSAKSCERCCEASFVKAGIREAALSSCASQLHRFSTQVSIPLETPKLSVCTMPGFRDLGFSSYRIEAAGVGFWKHHSYSLRRAVVQVTGGKISIELGSRLTAGLPCDTRVRRRLV